MNRQKYTREQPKQDRQTGGLFLARENVVSWFTQQLLIDLEGVSVIVEKESPPTNSQVTIKRLSGYVLEELVVISHDKRSAIQAEAVEIAVELNKELRVGDSIMIGNGIYGNTIGPYGREHFYRAERDGQIEVLFDCWTNVPETTQRAACFDDYRQLIQDVQTQDY